MYKISIVNDFCEFSIFFQTAIRCPERYMFSRFLILDRRVHTFLAESLYMDRQPIHFWKNDHNIHGPTVSPFLEKSPYLWTVNPHMSGRRSIYGLYGLY